MADSSSLQVVEERRSSVSPLGNGQDTHFEETDSLLDCEDFTDEYSSLKTLDEVEESGERVRTAVPFDASKTIKTGYLDHSGKTFQRWSKKYLRLYGSTLFLSKTEEDTSGQQVVLKEAIVSENSTKNVNHSFTVFTPSHQVVLAASSRKEMEQWLAALRGAASSQTPIHEGHQLLDGSHSWFMCSHTRPMYCNVCREALHGVAWHGMSCEVCKIKSHRRCVFGVSDRCKWTTRASMEEANAKIGYDFSIPHQWVEGNLPASSKCVVCLRTCGSVRRLQDFRCLWCKCTVHTECMERAEGRCSLGDLRLSVLPPSSLQQSDVISKGMWEPYKMIGHSPVLALVNSKSGDNQGVRFLRKLKYWLNPLQVLDLACTGPDLGLQLFQRFDKFRIIVFGGDGSIGWVLSAVDRYNLHSKTMVGVVPLGTGNDMARVMGWGSQFGDEEKLPIILKEMECSSFHLLDRWSVQFTMATDVDMSPIVEAMTPSLVQPSSIGSSLSQPDNPLPGPGFIVLSDNPATTTSPSSSSSNLEYQTPSPELAPRGQDFTRPLGCSANNDPLDVVAGNVMDAEGFEMCALPPQPSEELCSLPVNGMERGHNGMDRRLNRMERGQNGGSRMETEQIDLAALQTALASHLSTILISPEEAAVLAATEMVCQTVDEVINITLPNSQRKKLRIPNYRDDPLVQQCIILQQTLKDLLQLLKEEAKAATRPKQNGDSETERVRVLRPQEALMVHMNGLKRAMATVVSLRERERERRSSTERENERGSLSERERERGNSTEREGEGVSSADHSALRLPVSLLQSGSPNLSPCSSQSSLEMGLGTHGRLSVTSQGPGSIGSVVDPVPVLRETKEIACMNNYFGIGVDAEIAYQFHTSREKNPAQFKNRTKNKVRYGLLAGKQFTASIHKNLERRISLECDGRSMLLPQRLQGLVFLNIPSYMAGTNFWGTDREKRGFSAPSYDDKLMEVACITGFTQIATAKVLGIQNRRLAQCRYAKITLNERLPMQVDGEAWLQDPGTIVISHKNKARMIFKDKTFSQSLESWKQKNHGCSGGSGGGGMPVVARPVGLLDYLTEEDIGRYRKMCRTVRPLMELIRQEGAINQEVTRTLVPLLASTAAAMDRVFPAPDQVSETADIEHVQEMQKLIKSILQETIWFLDMRKISLEREPKMKECAQRLEGCIRDFLLHDPFASHDQRSASDSLLVSNPASSSSSSSPSAHRGRAALIVPDPAISASNMAKKVGKEVEEWNSEDVAWWLSQLGLSEYRDTVISHDIRGPQLRDMQTSDLQDLGITKVGHLTKFRAGIQALNPSMYNSPRAIKRGKPGRETR